MFNFNTEVQNTYALYYIDNQVQYMALYAIFEKKKLKGGGLEKYDKIKNFVADRHKYVSSILQYLLGEIGKDWNS